MNPFSTDRPMNGQDPFLFRYASFTWLLQSQDEERIVVSALEGEFKNTVIWDDPTEHQVWAPELHWISEKWYLFYAASNGKNETHRTYVLESQNSSPFGPYTKRQIGEDVWGIDMTYFRYKYGRYVVWSGWENNYKEFPQHLYIAEVNHQLEQITPRIRLFSPELTWEKSVAPILEGPQAWNFNGTVNLFYAANASWTTNYATGLLSLMGDNPLNPDNWVKHPNPIMTNAGHGCVFDDKFYYHRKMGSFPGWHDREIVSVPVKQIIPSFML